MKKITLLLVVVIFLMISNEAQSQGLTINPPSADAAALGKYGIYPTDLGHGLVNISIPLYTIKTRELQVPITLSYHASGIRVNDVSSWVGLGWVLNAGGVLTRSVRGLPDENGFAVAGHLFYTNAQLNAMTDQDASTMYSYLDSQASNNSDSESDLYAYNANGLSGTFVYNSNQQVIPTSLNNNKIIVNSAGNSYTVIADDGTSYTFDIVESTYNQNNSSTANTSFYLSKIVSANQTDVIYFDYTTDTTPYTDVYVSGQLSDNGTGNQDPNYNQQYVYSQQLTSITTPQTRYLSKIRFSSGYVQFITASDRKDVRKTRLSQIQVYTSNNTLVRTINLDQDYFLSTTPAPAVQSDPSKNVGYRLKLTGVDIQDANLTPVQSYSFNYNTSVTLPSYWSGTSAPDWNNYWGQDLFGYYNGVTNNNSMVSVSPSTYTAYKADRSVNPAYAQANVLTEIVYPTKGSTKFYYESNTTANQTSGLVGGLRISAIDDYINNDAIRVRHKTFSYSGGILGSSTYYLNFFTSSVYTQLIEDTFGYPQQSYSFPVTYYSNSPTFPLTENSNNGAYYQYITETDLDDSGKAMGKIDYQYEYEEDAVYSTSQSLPSTVPSARYAINYGATANSISDMSWARGPLKSQNTYKINADGSFTLVKSLTNTYTKFQVQDNYIGTNSFRSIVFPHNGGTSFSTAAGVKQMFQFMDIVLRNGVKKLTNSVEVADGATTSTNYFYDNTANYYLTRTETTNNRGIVEKIVNKYPQDAATISGLSSDASTALSTMVSRNMLSKVIEKDNYYNNSPTNSSRTDYGVLTIGGNSLVLPTTTLTAKGAAALEQRVTYSYDNVGNPLNISKISGPNISYQWGYNNTYPIAQASNASSGDIFYEGFEEGNGNGFINDAKAGHWSYNGNDTPYSKTLTGLDNGQYVLSCWQKSGDSWSLNSSTVTVTGNTITISQGNQLPYGQIDEIRFYPVGALMTTYTYDPLVGMTSAMDPRGNVSYYEYDAFNRLRTVKDQNHNILKAYCYNYQGQQTNCFVPQNDQPQYVYARIETSNVTYTYNMDYTEEWGYGDVYIRFYADANCTIPLSLPSDIDVTVVISEDLDADGGITNYPPEYDLYHVAAGSSSYYIGNQELSDQSNYTDSYGVYHSSNYSWGYDLADTSGGYIPESPYNF